MYDSLNWPGAVQELVQASEYLISTGSPKVALIPSGFSRLQLALGYHHQTLYDCQCRHDRVSLHATYCQVQAELGINHAWEQLQPKLGRFFGALHISDMVYMTKMACISFLVVAAS